MIKFRFLWLKLGLVFSSIDSNFKKYTLLFLGIMSLYAVKAQGERWENFEPPCCQSTNPNFVSVLDMGDLYINNVHITDPNDIILQSTGANALPSGAINGDKIDICHPDIVAKKLYSLTIISQSQSLFLIFPAFNTVEGSNVELLSGTEICASETIDLNDYIDNSDSSYAVAGDITWKLINGSGSISGSDVFTSSFAGPAQTETVTFRAVAGSGECADSAQISFTVYALADDGTCIDSTQVSDSMDVIDTTVTDVFDTTEVLDTNIVTVYDTITVIDTTVTDVFDTTEVLDTNIVTVYDTITVIDTTVTELYDTISISVEDTLNITLTISTGTDELEDELKVWSDGSNIYFESIMQEAYAFELISINGTKVLDVEDTFSNNQISLSGIAKGTYIARFTSLTDTEVTTTKKIVIK